MIIKAKIQLFLFVQIVCIHIFFLCSQKQRGKRDEQKRQKHEKTAAFYQVGEP